MQELKRIVEAIKRRSINFPFFYIIDPYWYIIIVYFFILFSSKSINFSNCLSFVYDYFFSFFSGFVSSSSIENNTFLGYFFSSLNIVLVSCSGFPLCFILMSKQKCICAWFVNKGNIIIITRNIFKYSVSYFFLVNFWGVKKHCFV